MTDVNLLSTNPPLSCVIKFLEDVIIETSKCGTLDPTKLKMAIEKFKNVTEWPPFPVETIISEIRAITNRLSLRITITLLLPLLIVSLIIVWLMVLAKWITPVLGLIFTIGLIVIFYAVGVIYMITISNMITTLLTPLIETIKTYIQEVEKSLPKVPQGILEGACAYNSIDWECGNTGTGN